MKELRVYLPDEVYAALEREAEAEWNSVQGIVVELLTFRVECEKAEGESFEQWKRRMKQARKM